MEGPITNTLIPGLSLIRFSEDCRFQIENKLIENQYSFKFKIASNQEASLKAWEEENEEYATWNLIDEEQDTAFLMESATPYFIFHFSSKNNLIYLQGISIIIDKFEILYYQR